MAGFFIHALYHYFCFTMPEKNKHVTSQVAFFYQRSTLDVMIFTFIDTYKFLHPGVSIKEAATAFVNRHSIAEDMFSLKSVITSYERSLKHYFDAQKERSK